MLAAATENEVVVVHPKDEQKTIAGSAENQGSVVDTYGGTIPVRWDEAAAVTPLGQMVFFIKFLKTAGLWDAFVKARPLCWKSHNAPGKANVLGTILLSVLAGHRRYPHLTASHKRRVIVLRRRIRGDLALAQKKLLAGTTPGQQLALRFVGTAPDGLLYEYAVLVTSLTHEILALAQHYRNRADVENNFDELKNQCGWTASPPNLPRSIVLVYIHDLSTRRGNTMFQFVAKRWFKSHSRRHRRAER
jgi:hypothetical protein